MGRGFTGEGPHSGGGGAGSGRNPHRKTYHVCRMTVHVEKSAEDGLPTHSSGTASNHRIGIFDTQEGGDKDRVGLETNKTGYERLTNVKQHPTPPKTARTNPSDSATRNKMEGRGALGCGLARGRPAEEGEVVAAGVRQ